MYVFIILAALSYHFLNVSSENVRESLFMNGPCFSYQFRCLNNKCIERKKFCDGRKDCDDNSDEIYCRSNGCPSNYPFFQCPYQYYKCIPAAWKCDGIRDCQNGEDERQCNIDDAADTLTVSHIFRAREKASKFIIGQRNSRKVEQKWGLDIPRKTVAVYMLNSTALRIAENFMSEITYELSINILSHLTLRKIDDVSTSELALYVNALLVSCIDPKTFHVVDLVKELRKRVDEQNTANAFAYLALCNAKEHMTANDVSKLFKAFQKANMKFHTDTQALIIMALVCAANQPESIIGQEALSELTLTIKRRQYRNGTVENTKTTALVLQALFASEPEPDEDNFDEVKAIKQILRTQEPDGSFGSFLNTYYVIPLLSFSTLVNISNVKCPSVPKDENEVLDDLMNQLEEKVSVTYSIWIGDGKILQRSMALKVSANKTFYAVMEYAAALDHKYKFEYNVRNRKPYLYALSSIVDDPETEMFWKLFHLTANSSQPILIEKSPADVIPENNDHLVYWYRKGM